MKATTSQKAKIGLFTILGILVLVAGVFVIGKKKNMFGDTFVIYGTFRNVGGLQVGNNIRFVGINVGTVQSIRILSDTLARVDMRLQSKIKPFLKDNAVATIGSDGLMGDKLVTISAGAETAGGFMKNGARIATVNPLEMDKTMTKIAAVADNAEMITGSLAEIFSQISHGKGSLGRLLYNDDLEKSLVGTVQSAGQTMQSIKQGSQGFGENMEALKHNIFLRGYYKKKARKEKEKEEQQQQQPEDNSKSKKK